MNFVYKQNHILVDNVEIVPMSMTKNMTNVMIIIAL